MTDENASKRVICIIAGVDANACKVRDIVHVQHIFLEFLAERDGDFVALCWNGGLSVNLVFWFITIHSKVAYLIF